MRGVRVVGPVVTEVKIGARGTGVNVLGEASSSAEGERLTVDNRAEYTVAANVLNAPVRPCIRNISNATQLQLASSGL